MQKMMAEEMMILVVAGAAPLDHQDREDQMKWDHSDMED
jgi:hypothetical protein